ncbi:hypothetical protein GY45DRAFT_48324 [Cubamyces sp. BRFM 1775]|nr:hypothetical protein GY45DRAFT_48324 [Cubamyces sp. BRFM 1775]
MCATGINWDGPRWAGFPALDDDRDDDRDDNDSLGLPQREGVRSPALPPRLPLPLLLRSAHRPQERAVLHPPSASDSQAPYTYAPFTTPCLPFPALTQRAIIVLGLSLSSCTLVARTNPPTPRDGRAGHRRTGSARTRPLLGRSSVLSLSRFFCLGLSKPPSSVELLPCTSHQ